MKYEIRDVKNEIDNQVNSISQCRDISDTNRLDIADLKKAVKDLQKQVTGNNNSQSSLIASNSQANMNLASNNNKEL